MYHEVTQDNQNVRVLESAQLVDYEVVADLPRVKDDSADVVQVGLELQRAVEEALLLT